MKKKLFKSKLIKKVASWLFLLLYFLSFFSGPVWAAGQEAKVKKPYEKVIYESGSWFSLWDQDQLIYGYNGLFDIDEDLFKDKESGREISQLPEISFRLSQDHILQAVSLPYVYQPPSLDQPAEVTTVYIELEDSRGNLYGPYVMKALEQRSLVGQAKEAAQDRTEKDPLTEEKGQVHAQEKNIIQTYRPQGELRLAKGTYRLRISDPANLVRTKKSGLEGAVFIKGYDARAYDKYREKLLLWEMENNPEKFASKTLIKQTLEDKEVPGQELEDKAYTLLGSAKLYDHVQGQVQIEEEDLVKEGQGGEERLASFPLYLTLPSPAFIDDIAFNTYNDGLGAPPGTVTITDLKEGIDYGTFPAQGASLAGVANGIWRVRPALSLPAGSYRVDVSDESVITSQVGGSPDFYVGASPPSPIDHDFSGSYLIDLAAQKTSSIGLAEETGKGKDAFNVSQHPLIIMDRGDHLLIMGTYEGLSLSQRCLLGSRRPDKVQGRLEFNADLSGTPARTSVGADVDFTLTKPEEGPAYLSFGGRASYAREASEEEGGDYNLYQVSGTGSFSGQDIPSEALPFLGPGLAAAGSIPGPDSPEEAALGILFPPLAMVLAGLLENLFSPNTKKGLAGGLASSLKDQDPGQVYDFGDGREYVEGQTYTFDDGRIYEIKEGDFSLVGQLAEGQRYTNPDGDDKIWSGGQAWQASDLDRQRGVNEDYRQAHERDWEEYSSAPDERMQAAFDEISRDEELYGKLGRMQRGAWSNHMASPGEIDDIYSRIDGLMKEMESGRPADEEKIRRIRDHMAGRLRGDTIGEEDLPPGEIYGGWLDAGILGAGLVETGRNLTHATTADGSMSWKGLAGRVVLGGLTGGQSEWIFRTAGAAYTMHDAVEEGASNLGALGAAVGRVTTEWATTNILSGIAGTAQSAGASAMEYLKHSSMGIKGLGSSILSGGAKGASAWSRGMASQFTDLASKGAWAGQLGKMADSLGRGVSRIDGLLSGKEGLKLPGASVKESLAGSARLPLKSSQAKKLKEFARALDADDAESLAKQYAQGGMKQLSELQKKGYISADAARKANRLLSSEVNASIQKGTRSALNKTQKETGVRIKELIVGDSGSGAKKSVGRIMTDADRTLIPRFEEAGLKRYMRTHNLSRKEAYNSLCKELQKNHTSAVGESLSQGGLSADDVGFASYDRIGSASGQADSYGSRFTNLRQAGSGSAQVYKPDGQGGFKIHKVSGQTAVDQNLLNNQHYGLGDIPSQPTKLLARDVPSIVRQQTTSLLKSSQDPLSVAKAITRANKVSHIIKNEGLLPRSIQDMNQRFVAMADDIYADPSSMAEVLRRNGKSLEVFLKESKDLLSSYEQTLSALDF